MSTCATTMQALMHRFANDCKLSAGMHFSVPAKGFHGCACSMRRQSEYSSSCCAGASLQHQNLANSEVQVKARPTLSCQAVINGLLHHLTGESRAQAGHPSGKGVQPVQHLPGVGLCDVTCLKPITSIELPIINPARHKSSALILLPSELTSFKTSIELSS